MANNQPVLFVNEHYMLELGMILGRLHSTSDKADTSRFRELFGICPLSASKAFTDIQTTDMGEDLKIQKPDPMYFLTTLYWLRGYGIETRVCGACGVRSAKTLRDHAWKYLAAIQALKASKVRKVVL